MVIYEITFLVQSGSVGGGLGLTSPIDMCDSRGLCDSFYSCLADAPLALPICTLALAVKVNVVEVRQECGLSA
eukprot:6394480-Lingulodinium_polyedra.AAC.1